MQGYYRFRPATWN